MPQRPKSAIIENNAGKDAFHPPNVERRKAEAAALEVGEDDPGHEIAGQDKKDVDPGRIRRERSEACVKEEHRQDRDSSQTVQSGRYSKSRGLLPSEFPFP